MKFAAYAIVPETKWILVLAADIKEVQVPVNQIGQFMIILGITAVIISCLLVFI